MPYKSVEYGPRHCIRCSTVFYPKRKDKVFCSRNCKTRARRKKYTLGKKTFCEFCGFVALHPCQLDVDHIDGDHSNNEKSNLQTLCANCHRLKTVLNEDWRST